MRLSPELGMPIFADLGVLGEGGGGPCSKESGNAGSKPPAGRMGRVPRGITVHAVHAVLS